MPIPPRFLPKFDTPGLVTFVSQVIIRNIKINLYLLVSPKKNETKALLPQIRMLEVHNDITDLETISILVFKVTLIFSILDKSSSAIPFQYLGLPLNPAAVSNLYRVLVPDLQAPAPRFVFYTIYMNMSYLY